MEPLAEGILTFLLGQINFNLCLHVINSLFFVFVDICSRPLYYGNYRLLPNYFNTE